MALSFLVELLKVLHSVLDSLDGDQASYLYRVTQNDAVTHSCPEQDSVTLSVLFGQFMPFDQPQGRLVNEYNESTDFVIFFS